MTANRIQVQNVPSIPLAVIRRRVTARELAKVVPECCGMVWTVVQAQQAKGGRHVAIYWDAGIRLEIGVELEGAFVEQGDVIRSATPGGHAAVLTHFGPYRGLGSAHEAIQSWCKANGHRLAGPSWEIYGHWQPDRDADPALIRTDVYYQLAGS
jgi:effector-binding domain-containing protein